MSDAKLVKLVSRAMDEIDAQKRKEMLASIGVCDGRFDLNTYVDKAVWAGFNDLATKEPAIASQWHPTKNAGLTPEMVTCGSVKKVWWFLPYDDPVSGEHYDFEWETTINSRVSGNECPYLSGQTVWPGFNDLGTKYPEIAKQWHPTKNKDLTPEMVTVGSKKKVWWFLPYDDPASGKHYDFEWEAYIYDRVGGSECPYLSGKAVWPGFNDLGTKYPEIAKQWHPTKNKDLTPEMVTVGSNKKVWWFLPYDDPASGKHYDFEWEAKIFHRVGGGECPYLYGKAVWPGFNDLETKYPKIAKEWHPTKNKNLTPRMVTPGCGKKVWWLYSYDDPETGKHFDFEWQATIISRVNGIGCPYLTGASVWKGFNDLETKYPEIAKEWHPTKNKNLTPDMITCGTIKKVWWFLPYDDPNTGKHLNGLT